MHPSRPNVLFMQKHWDVMRTDDGGQESWRGVFPETCRRTSASQIAVNSNEPNTVYVVPIKSDSEHYPPDGKLRVYGKRAGGDEWEALTNGLPQEDCYVNILRESMAVDQTLDSCGVYFGTTGGQVYASSGRRRYLECNRARSTVGAIGRGSDASLISDAEIRVRAASVLRAWFFVLGSFLVAAAKCAVTLRGIAPGTGHQALTRHEAPGTRNRRRRGS